MQDWRNLLEALEKTRLQRRSNAEKALAQPNPEGTNTIVNTIQDLEWMPTHD